MRLKRAFVAILLGTALLFSGCGRSIDVDGPVEPTPNYSSTLSPEEALRILYQELLARTEHTVAFLTEARVGPHTIYAFQHMINGSAPTIDFVHSKTGKVYYDSVELLLDIFINSEDKEQYKAAKYINKDIYFIQMQSVNSPEPLSWSIYIFNDNAYLSMEEAKKAVVKAYVENHPTLSLLGKPLEEVEKITKVEAQSVAVNAEGDQSRDIPQITLDNIEIYFTDGTRATELYLGEQQEVLGVKIGETFNEISDKLGMPDSFGPDEKDENTYTMRYIFESFKVEFYGNDKDGETLKALVQLT